MRAITLDSFGGPEVLVPADVERPVPGAAEVLVRVRAAGVNPVDLATRAGYFGLVATPPAVPGWDLAGVVEAVGPDVTRFAVGDEVFGLPLFPRPAGTHAEYAVVPQNHLARTPAALSAAEAGALPLAGLTAWQAVVELGRVDAGDRVLIHAAAGGVGHLAVQIAKAREAHVTVTARPENHAFVRSLGADEVIDYTEQDFAQTPAAFDVAIDLVGGEYGWRTLRTVRPGGRLVTVVAHNPGVTEEEAAERQVRLLTVSVRPSAANLAALAHLVETGRLRVHVEWELPLEEAAKAHELLALGGARGKGVLIP
ncbi:NADP-dependent oxidoreductase [Catenulispora subtropica]|uniref:NADP-dependent oxidoreductase n=1 Tax=Catenulispora subtropica TaxID=450798 RepID=A0ABP5EGF3_9ACTN